MGCDLAQRQRRQTVPMSGGGHRWRRTRSTSTVAGHGLGTPEGCTDGHAGSGGQPLAGVPAGLPRRSSLCANSWITRLCPCVCACRSPLTCDQASITGPPAMASPISGSRQWCSTPASSSASRGASTSPACSTMPTKSSYQSSASGSQYSSGRQAWAATASAIASLTARPCAPGNSLSARKRAHSACSLACSSRFRSARQGRPRRTCCQSASGMAVGATRPGRISQRRAQPGSCCSSVDQRLGALIGQLVSWQQVGVRAGSA